MVLIQYKYRALLYQANKIVPKA